MKILEELEQDRKALAEIGEILPDEEEILEEPKVEEVEEDKPEEVVVSEVKEEPKVVEDEDLKGPARLRYEKNQAEKRAEAAEARARELEAKLNKPSEEVIEEEVTQVLPEVAELIEERRYAKAGEEFTVLEAKFREVAPDDFEDVSNQYKAALYHSNRVNNPDLTHEQLLMKTNKDLLIKAGTYMHSGKDPIAEMYESAKRLGFKAIPKEVTVEEVKEEPKPNLKKVAENKARNAGTAGVSSGAGQGGILTAAVLAEMSVAEYSKIPVAERKRIMYGK